MKKLAIQDLTVLKFYLRECLSYVYVTDETNSFLYYCNDTRFIKFLMKILIFYYLIGSSLSAFNIF